MSFEKYLEKVKNNSNQAIKVEWLNYDESVNFEFTNSLYDIDVVLNVNYQNGSRRTCTLTLNNDNNQFPINFNNIWIGQKFKLWMGVYLDDGTPYYYPQGVFYVSNPEEVYSPTTKTVKINGVDKWAYLDGTLHGFLSGTYKTGIGTNLYDAIDSLLLIDTFDEDNHIILDLNECFDIINDESYCFKDDGNGRFIANNSYGVDRGTTAQTSFVAKQDVNVSFDYTNESTDVSNKFYITFKRTTNTMNSHVTGSHSGIIRKGEKIIFKFKRGNGSAYGSATVENFKCKSIGSVIDPVIPKLSPYLLNKNYSDGNKVIECPYTAIVERGQTYADILLEYATILCAHIYYDANGRLTIEPMSDEVDDIVDTNKEIVWDFSVEEKTFLGLTQTYNFSKVYNDIIVLGNIVNGKQFKARVQNRNIMSDTCVQKIGLKTKEPFEDNQYYSDEQCKELAIYYAKVDTILQKSGDINSLPLYHIDVNKLVTVSTPNNNMGRELFLITGFTINSLKTMSINITSVNDLKNFSVVEG